MQRTFMALTFVGIVCAGSVVWAATSRCAALLVSVSPSSLGILERISSSMTEPIRLVLVGVCLIGLSLVVRRRSSRKRGR